MQAGDEKKAGESLTIEELLEAAAHGRSKYDRVAEDIDRLRAGGVTLRAIAAWVRAQGIKSEVGELGQWLKRRKARQARLLEHQALLAQGGRQAGKEVQHKVPLAEPARRAAPPDPSDRQGTSAVEKELDALIDRARQKARTKRSPFAPLKDANKR